MSRVSFISFCCHCAFVQNAKPPPIITHSPLKHFWRKLKRDESDEFNDHSNPYQSDTLAKTIHKFGRIRSHWPRYDCKFDMAKFRDLKAPSNLINNLKIGIKVTRGQNPEIFNASSFLDPWKKLCLIIAYNDTQYYHFSFRFFSRRWRISHKPCKRWIWCIPCFSILHKINSL